MRSLVRHVAWLALLGAASLARADATAPRSALPGGAPSLVVARLVDGERRIIACGVIAFIGVYTYEIESVVSGPARSGRVVVDVLCPDFYLKRGKLEFKIGERHLLTLSRPHRTYAGATAPPSPDPLLPRAQATKVSLAPEH
jgi:hypothetical protein